MGIKTSVFHINSSADIETVWQQLEEIGCNLLYSETDADVLQIFGNLPSGLKKEDLLTLYPEILAIHPIELPEIDWEAQWAAHENYREGFLYVDLQDYAKESVFTDSLCVGLKMIPGPGFGDLSHPTTRLVLRLMGEIVRNKDVVDVGCGSGILSLAAVSMGARSVCGVDIEEQALVHSRENSFINGMEDKIVFLLPQDLKKIFAGSVVLMNMIQSEQVVAWESMTSFSDAVSMFVTSGILSEGRADYLELCSVWGWDLIAELEEDGWLGFVFSKALLEQSVD